MNVTRTDVAWHLNECIACMMQNNGSAAFVGVGVGVGIGVVAFARLLFPRDKMEARPWRHRDGFGRPCVGHQYTCDVQVTPGIKPSGWRRAVGFSEDAEDDRQGERGDDMV